jgi:hypothetical protein
VGPHSVIRRVGALPLLFDRRLFFCLSAAYRVGAEGLQREQRRREYPVRTTRKEEVHGDNYDDRHHARPPAETREEGEAHEQHSRELSGRDQGASGEYGGPEHEAVSATSPTSLRRRLLLSLHVASASGAPPAWVRRAQRAAFKQPRERAPERLRSTVNAGSRVAWRRAQRHRQVQGRLCPLPDAARGRPHPAIGDRGHDGAPARRASRATLQRELPTGCGPRSLPRHADPTVASAWTPAARTALPLGGVPQDEGGGS